MTHAERNQGIREALDKFSAKNRVSPSAGRQALIETGIYTTDGEVSVEYGGEPKSKKAKNAA